MLSESLKGNKAIAIFIAAVGLAFYLMNLYSPLFCDDWHYCFIFGTTTPITSIGDIFVSQYHHYFEFNGRVVPHLFVQFFDGIAGKGWFNVVNTVMFLLFLHLIVTEATKDKNCYYKILTLATAAIIILYPGFKFAFLWMSGACNYLWTGVFLLSFHRLLRKETETKLYMYPLLFFFGLFCGWTHEGLVIGLCASYMAYFSINRKKLTPLRIALLSGFCVGVLMMIVSPANFHRAMKGLEGAGLSSIIRIYMSALLKMADIRIFFITLVLMVFSYIRNKKAFKTFFHDNLIWIVAVCVSFVFILFTKHDTAHSRFGIELFSLLLLLKLCVNIRIQKAVCSACNTLMCVFLVFAVSACRANFLECENQIAQIKSKKGYCICETNEIKTPPMLQRFIMPIISNNMWGNTNAFVRYCNITHSDLFLHFLPSAFLDDIKRNPSHYTRFHTDKYSPFYAKRIPKGQGISEVTFLLRIAKEDEIPFYFRPFADRLDRFSATEIKTKGYKVVDVYGQSYLLVDKNEMIDYRLQDITYKAVQSSE